MKQRTVLLLVVTLWSMANIASADMVQGINIDFVTIGNAGNPGDTRTGTNDSYQPLANPYGCGAVAYNYQIGKYEITNGQWDAFVSAAGVPTGNEEGYSYNAYWTGDNIPTGRLSWYEAAQFCNYLTSGDKSLGAYLFSDGDFTGIDRSSAISSYGIAYVIPTEDEWYKAAYYTGSGYSTYANGTDVAPIAGFDTNYEQDDPFDGPWDVGTGTMEQNGTFDMMGNFFEWNETMVGSERGGHGGSYHYDVYGLMSSFRNGYFPYHDHEYVGFRVAAVTPVPSAVILGGIGLAFSGLKLRKRREMKVQKILPKKN